MPGSGDVGTNKTWCTIAAGFQEEGLGDPPPHPNLTQAGLAPMPSAGPAWSKRGASSQPRGPGGVLGKTGARRPETAVVEEAKPCSGKTPSHGGVKTHLCKDSRTGTSEIRPLGTLNGLGEQGPCWHSQGRRPAHLSRRDPAPWNCTGMLSSQ